MVGQVATVHTLMSEDTEYNYEKLGKDMQSLVPAGVKVVRTEIQPLAFGLKMLEVTCIMLDGAGLIEELEKIYSSIEGISNVEVKEVGLI